MPLVSGTVLKEEIVLERELGRGGMGVVWLALHRTLGVHVAVKVLEVAPAVSQEARARFLREARASARVDSVHVVRVSDMGQAPEGEPFLVMEYLRGHDLKDQLQNHGPLSLAQTAIVLDQVCDALDRAHALGIVHRDLKPANIFLVAGSRLFVKVLDFGVAKLDGDMSLTATDALMGTPYYMSPEQFVSPRSVDHRSDLWSLAVVAYACVTGRLPFQGDAVGAIALAVHSSDFRLPSTLIPSLPGAIDAWFQRALSPDRERRFQSARELSAMFSAAVSQQPAAEPTSAPIPTSTAVLSVGPPPAQTIAQAPTLPGLAQRTTPLSTSTKPPRSTRWLAWTTVMLLVAGAASATWLLAIRPRMSGARSSARPTAVAPPCVASSLPDERALEACDALCNAGTASACTILGDRLSTDPQLLDDARALTAYRRACDAEDGAACNSAARLVARGRGAPKSRTDAAELYRKGCDHASALACSNLAEAHTRGVGVARDPARAFALRTRGCDSGVMADCTELAVLHFKGQGTARDVVRAGALFKQACDGGSLAGCAALAMAHETGRGATKDHTTAVALAKRACAANELQGCAVLAEIAFVERTPDDDARALAYLVPACEAQDDDACRFLGYKYQVGYGVLRDEARAARLYQTACDLDDMVACHNLGTMYWRGAGVAQDFARAIALLRRACDEGGQGCVALGQAYEAGQGVLKDYTVAAALYRSACDLYQADGCVLLGSLYDTGNGVAQDPTRVVELWQKGCDLGSQIGCDGLAAKLLVGLGAPKDEARAVKLLHTACDADFAPSCGRLGEMYRTGTAVPRDIPRALTLFKKACAGGEAGACASAEKL